MKIQKIIKRYLENGYRMAAGKKRKKIQSLRRHIKKLIKKNFR